MPAAPAASAARRGVPSWLLVVLAFVGVVRRIRAIRPKVFLDVAELLLDRAARTVDPAFGLLLLVPSHRAKGVFDTPLQVLRLALDLILVHGSASPTPASFRGVVGKLAIEHQQS